MNIRELKNKLCLDIADLVKQFEKDTGAYVEHIDISHDRRISEVEEITIRGSL